MQITLVLDSVAPVNLFFGWQTVWHLLPPYWMAAIFQYGGRAQFSIFQIFQFFKTAILQYGYCRARFKYNITFYNMANSASFLNLNYLFKNLLFLKIDGWAVEFQTYNWKIVGSNYTSRTNFF